MEPMTPDGKTIVDRLREQSRGVKRWRVQHKQTKAFLIWFKQWESIEAKEWFDAQVKKYPEDMEDYELALVDCVSSHDLLLREAADLIEFLTSRFQTTSANMDGNHSYRFDCTSWPMRELRGPNIFDALAKAFKAQETESNKTQQNALS